ncbi:sensor histidine kinase [Nocardiopsis sp. FR6]|uniref:sensor histidine kinase n=1 Tax=Nocardiopsis sp. FR6 TaxID=2605986 RepID=UPI00135C2587|nr:GAF domain-containing protein [Nocardiopsis sp. FR6]
MSETDPAAACERPLVPRMRLDELLLELQSHIDTVMLTRDRMRSLLEAVVTIGTGLDLETMLRRVVEAAMALVDARYGALGIFDDAGGLQQFIPVGLTEEEVAAIEHWPEGRGLLGLLLKNPQPLRLADLSEHPESHGFPAGHPPMRAFLGVPILVRDEVFGNLYLTEKVGGGTFDEDDETVVTALATAAGVAIENARLYDETRRREVWLEASDQITTQLLTGSDTAEVLHLIARRARDMSGADLAAILTGEEGNQRLTVRVADGGGEEAITGRTVPVEGSLTGRVFRDGDPLITDIGRSGVEVSPPLDGLGLGPVLAVPLGAQGSAQGVLLLGRRVGTPPFTPAHLHLLHTFTGHAAVALELAEARVGSERLSLLEDRDRIAKDLHDVVIQRLFSVGMSLMSSVRQVGEPRSAQRIRQAVDDIDDTIRQIRTTVFALQDLGGEDSPWLRNQVLEVVNAATGSLGFSAGLRLDGPIDGLVPDEVAEHVLAVLREALSNAARHARASRVDVRVDAGARVTVEVEDDGTGLPEEGRRSGLRNLADRASALGGTFEAGPGPLGGTRLHWSVPLEQEPTG